MRRDSRQHREMKTRNLLLIAAAATSIGSLSAEAVKDREGAVRKDRAAMENDKRWVYNDVRRGLEEGKRTGKPVLVVLRCVPCIACSGIDSAVLLQNDELSPLLDRFVCVRLINANALDLTLFQVDFDLSFSTVFFNGDGTVYGRYGSWAHQKNAQDTTTVGYRRAMEAALALHAGYPGNKAALAGKQCVSLPFKTPIEMPMLAGKYQRDLDWSGKVVGSCVHCHQVGDAMRTWYRDRREPIPSEWIHPWPGPETIGMTLAPDQIAKVESVDAGSFAASAGLQADDEIVSLAGQPLISIADLSWVLQTSPDDASLPVVVKRGADEKQLTLAVKGGWRNKSDTSRRVSSWPMRGMATGGLVVFDLDDDSRTQRGLAKDSLALSVKSVGNFGKHAEGKKAGFQKDDIITEIDGITRRLTEGELFDHLLTKRMPGDRVKASVLRGTERIELSLPMQ